MSSFLGPTDRVPPEHGVQFVKYCSILLQALTIQADEDFLYAVYELSKIRGASWEEEQTQYVLTQFHLFQFPSFLPASLSSSPSKYRNQKTSPVKTTYISKSLSFSPYACHCPLSVPIGSVGRRSRWHHVFRFDLKVNVAFVDWNSGTLLLS